MVWDELTLEQRTGVQDAMRDFVRPFSAGPTDDTPAHFREIGLRIKELLGKPKVSLSGYWSTRGPRLVQAIGRWGRKAFRCQPLSNQSACVP